MVAGRADRRYCFANNRSFRGLGQPKKRLAEQSAAAHALAELLEVRRAWEVRGILGRLFEIAQ